MRGHGVHHFFATRTAARLVAVLLYSTLQYNTLLYNTILYYTVRLSRFVFY
jgi:hypothetical protein